MALAGPERATGTQRPIGALALAGGGALAPGTRTAPAVLRRFAGGSVSDAPPRSYLSDARPSSFLSRLLEPLGGPLATLRHVLEVVREPELREPDSGRSPVPTGHSIVWAPSSGRLEVEGDSGSLGGTSGGPEGTTCIWVASSDAAPDQALAEELRQRLRARRVPAELWTVGDRDLPGLASSRPVHTPEADPSHRADPSPGRGPRALVVVGPPLGAEAAGRVREQVGALIRVTVDTADPPGGPRPIPTTYRFVKGPDIVEASISPPRTEPDRGADVVVGGPPRPAGELATEVVDALVRTGWLALPSSADPARAPVSSDERPPDAALPRPWIHLTAAR